ncbi:hypothetical protein PPERSA_08895 [Pseudocohnilembus persalinus]|uniref:Uncharacterized protein n=1 Tax=Pseudocohnilembus persalinus TaxID=266149 RepID=A0A0V0Q7K9_PSEPJ|nr:hypothetical protein PPERSA_08895 [Pseudocohnilembus persalinus]|eukprot:KRW98204.1 hypothetical protein PPERSA_08895 [Pseudocohnilembus persalinus]
MNQQYIYDYNNLELNIPYYQNQEQLQNYGTITNENQEYDQNQDNGNKLQQYQEQINSQLLSTNTGGNYENNQYNNSLENSFQYNLVQSNLFTNSQSQNQDQNFQQIGNQSSMNFNLQNSNTQYPQQQYHNNNDNDEFELEDENENTNMIRNLKVVDIQQQNENQHEEQKNDQIQQLSEINEDRFSKFQEQKLKLIDLYNDLFKQYTQQRKNSDNKKTRGISLPIDKEQLLDLFIVLYENNFKKKRAIEKYRKFQMNNFLDNFLDKYLDYPQQELITMGKNSIIEFITIINKQKRELYRYIDIMVSYKNQIYQSKDFDDFCRILDDLEFLKETRYLEYNGEKTSLSHKTKLKIVNDLEKQKQNVQRNQPLFKNSQELIDYIKEKFADVKQTVQSIKEIHLYDKYINLIQKNFQQYVGNQAQNQNN